MTEVKYLIDANVIASRRIHTLLTDDFINNYCVIIDEIAHELEDTTLAEKINKFRLPPNISVLNILPDITDDLIERGILKTDHGNGDALLIATAIYIKGGMGESQGVFSFISTTPVIVTEEKAIQAYCKEEGIDCMNQMDFLAILNTIKA